MMVGIVVGVFLLAVIGIGIFGSSSGVARPPGIVRSPPDGLLADVTGLQSEQERLLGMMRDLYRQVAAITERMAEQEARLVILREMVSDLLEAARD